MKTQIKLGLWIGFLLAVMAGVFFLSNIGLGAVSNLSDFLSQFAQQVVEIAGKLVWSG